MSDGEATLSYGELTHRARAAATELRSRGVDAGDHVMIVGRNTTSWVVAALGVLFAGATVAPLGHRSTRHDLRVAVEQLRPRLVLADADLLPEELGPSTLAVNSVAAGARDPVAASVLTDPVIDADSDALVLPTSGTSGSVSFVAMAHRQLSRLYRTVSRTLGIRTGDRILGAVPLAHSFGLNGVLLDAFFVGAMVRLTSEHNRRELAALIRAEGITVLAGPPTIYYDLDSAGAEFSGDSVRLAITGGTEVAADRMRAICDRLDIPEAVVGYGMTETCGTVALGRIPYRTEIPEPMLTPVADVETTVVDPFDSPVPNGAAGRLLVRGFNIARRYAGSGEAVPLRAGWFDTGDIARLDAHGRLAVVARRKDTVIVSGFNVFPSEVEQVLLNHPRVAGAAVVGVPDERQGERLVACVVPRLGADVDDAGLIEHARGVLAPYKVPREYLVLDRLPTTATGKVSRAQLRQRLRSE